MRMCKCGCGEPLALAPHNNKSKGWVKGQPCGEYKRYHNVRGPAHHGWAGEQRRLRSGYTMVRAEGHPRAANGWLFEHIAVAERAMGKPLPVTAPVHHVNEDKGDNRPSNLVVCEDNAYHRLLHARMRALAASGNAGWLRCRYCKEYDAPEAMSRNARSQTTAWHRACQAAYKRERYAKRAAPEPARQTVKGGV